MALTFTSVDKTYCVTIQMKAIEQYFHVVLFIMRYKVVLTFTSVDKTLMCDPLNSTFMWGCLGFHNPKFIILL